MLIKIQLLKYGNRHMASQTIYIPDDMPPEVFQEIIKFIEKKAQECDKSAPPKEPPK